MSYATPRCRLATALCLLPLAATAQTTPTEPPVATMQDIIVTASRSSEPLADAVGDVTVINARQLQSAQGESIAQIIGQAPGVQFITNGGPQTATGLFVRGTGSNQTLVLIDGLRVNDSTSGLAALPAIDPATIERIEILRGAASSLYGSDAIGGVINIITKKGEQERPLSAWANIGAGSEGTAKSSLGLSGASQGWDYSLSASAERSSGFNATRRTLADGRPNGVYAPDRDGYQGAAFSGTLGYRWAPGHHLGLTAYDGYKRGDYDAGEFVPDAYAYYREQMASLTSSDDITDWWHSDLRVGFTKNGYDDRGFQNVLNSLNRTYSWTQTFTPVSGQHLSLLLERQEERIQSSTTRYTQDARDDNAAALIYKGAFGRLHTQASLRNNHYTGYGNETTGSLGADLDLTDTWQVGLAGNTGFRIPTFNNLYWPYEDFGLYGSFSGNPDLRPEKSRNVEAHLRYQTSQANLSLTVYQNRIDDLIVASVCDASFNCAPQNISRATIRGATLAGSYRMGNTTFHGSADFMDPRNDNPAPGQDSQLPQRARQVFHLGVAQRIEALKIGADYQYTGERVDASTQARLGGYSLVNLTAAYDFTKSLGVQVRWNNVFDKDYVLVDGYNTPGSNVFVNLSWKM
ncbi:Vitamin B12 transporter OS=Castellaniella defragrans OX=75697 GN=HNR28_001469 PE=3 SV=1 [Castellaniella defragrans]